MQRALFSNIKEGFNKHIAVHEKTNPLKHQYQAI